MKDTVKRIMVFLLALSLCCGQAAIVAYAGEPDGEAVYMEEPADELENVPEPEDGDDSAVPGAKEVYTDSEQDGETGVEETGDGEPGGLDGEGQEDINEEEQEITGGDGLPAEEAELEQPKPEEAELSEDIVYDEEELAAWCEAHMDSGGRVTLGAVITLTDHIILFNDGFIIDTGPYGIVYDGGCIATDTLEITGEGVDVPVLDVHTVIQLGEFWEAGWNDMVRELEITATGRDGMGGVAVRIRQDDGYSAYYREYFEEGLIRSYGAGAIGLYLDEPLAAYCFRIEVEGDDSTAVYAPQGANLYYCKLTAEGAGASVVSGSGEIVLDTCAASPEPQNAQVVNYRIAGFSGSGLYYPVKQYGNISDISKYVPSLTTFLLSAGDGHPSVTDVLPVSWERDSIDTGILGPIQVQGSFYAPFQGLGLEDDFPLEFVADVRDPEMPCISRIRLYEDLETGTYASLTFWDTYEREDENVILWRSDDGGESWYDITDSPAIEWHGSWIHYYYGEISGITMLQLEVLGKGESNIVTLHSVDGTVVGGPGGDRTGTDRVVVGNSNGSGSDGLGDENQSGTGVGGDAGESGADAGSDSDDDAGSGSDDGGGKGSENTGGDHGDQTDGQSGTQSGNGEETQAGGTNSSGDSGSGDSDSGKKSGSSNTQEETNRSGSGGADNSDTAKSVTGIQEITESGGADEGLQTESELFPSNPVKPVIAAIDPFIETAYAAETETVENTSNDHDPAPTEAAAAASPDTDVAAIPVTRRSATATTGDVHGAFALSALAAILFAGVFLRRRIRGERRRQP